ncbi:hypothetical protein [Brevibacillus sp. MCWH]|uniref:hypothetical protein n=1 Tax=Brevibacillus sp. MCWH TaxID=2508871 RepID=UPI001492A060|nr:hypothetical protein [Brevibacillus sp. MCWH]NNV02310.1 hypothetical protein [Brevibacillus sp. MCWH]
MRKILFTSVIVLLAIGFFAIGYASDKPEQQALKDYQRIQKQFEKSVSAQASIDNLKLSNFSIPIFFTLTAEEIASYEGKELSDILQPSDQWLWFMQDNGETKGIVIADSKEPIQMGGENYSKDLMKLYKAIQQNDSEDNDVRYFEFQGGGIFLSVDKNKEEVWLTSRAAELLNLSPYKKLSPETVLKKMKERITNTKDLWEDIWVNSSEQEGTGEQYE